MNYVVYSHTDFEDILEVQTDYLQDTRDKFLFINRSNLTLNLKRIYSNYRDVLYYDDSQPYASRLIHCLEKLKQKHDVAYCLFTHDVDIVLHRDQGLLDNCLNIMKDRKIHRIDLQLDLNPGNDSQQLINLNTLQVDEQLRRGYSYIRKDVAGDYAYNVNPSIYQIQYFIELLKVDKNLGYRQIESDSRVQHYAKDVVKVHKLKAPDGESVQCGYFYCLPFYLFLHITHGGKLVPTHRDDAFFKKQPHYDVREEYGKILDKYNLSSKRTHSE